MFAAGAFYLLAINLAAFAAFWADKRAAGQRRRRTRESTLLTLATIGGSAGAIAAQQVLRHKTRKEPFRTRLWSIAGVQTLLLVTVAAAQVIAR